MLRKVFWITAIALLLSSALFAGGAQEKGQPAIGEGKGELVNWTWTFKCIDEWLVPAFNKVYPNIRIKTVPMALPETHDKIFAAIAAGSGAPDFATILSDYMQKFIDQGGLVDMTDYMNGHKGEFPKYKVQMNSDERGRIWGVPFNSAPVGLWYRQDIMEKFGLELPETWDEYLNLGRKVIKQGVYITTVSVAAKGMDTTMEGEVGIHGLLTQQQAGSYFDKNDSPTLNTRESKRAMQLMNTMVQEGLSANVPQGAPSYYQLMDDSKLFSIISAAWYVNVLDNFIKEGSAAFGNYRFQKLPAFDKGGLRASNLGGAELCIFEQTPTDKAELAMKFIDFSCANIEGKRVHAQYGEFPSWLPSWKDPAIVNMTFKMTGDQKLNQVFAEIEPLVPMWRQPPRYTEIQRILQAKMNAIFTGEKTIDQALAEAQKEAAR